MEGKKDASHERRMNVPKRGQGFKQRARRGIVLTAYSGETIIGNLCLVQTLCCMSGSGSRGLQPYKATNMSARLREL